MLPVQLLTYLPSQIKKYKNFQMLNKLIITAAFSLVSCHAAHAACDAQPWTDYKGVTLSKLDSSYFFVTDHLRVDADGAPNAYHPDNKGLDYLANAGYPDHDWWDSVLQADPNDKSKPFVQTEGEFAGYYVSMTTLFDKTKSKYDASRYVDATSIPYLVFPGKFFKMKGTGLMGDIGMAFNLSSGESSAFVVADRGPYDHALGEISIKLAENLGGQNVNPKNGKGAPKGDILYVLFPASAKQYPWPLSVEQLEDAAAKQIEAIGGIETFKECVVL